MLSPRESAGGQAFSLRHLPLLDSTAIGGSWFTAAFLRGFPAT